MFIITYNSFLFGGFDFQGSPLWTSSGEAKLFLRKELACDTKAKLVEFYDEDEFTMHGVTYVD